MDVPTLIAAVWWERPWIVERLPLCNHSWCSGKRLEEKDLAALVYQCDVWSHSLICTCWGHNTVRALFLRTLSTLFIYLLSNPKRVNQKPQWGEGRREMDIDVKRQRIYFLLLCIGVSCFRAFVCFMGFLIKTRKACVVYDVEGCVGEVVCLIACVVGGRRLLSPLIR